MPQTTLGEGLNSKIELDRELIDRVYEYIKAHRPCRICDVIDAMRQFFSKDLTRDEVKPFVIKALAILMNEEKRVFLGVISVPDKELNFVYTTQ